MSEQVRGRVIQAQSGFFTVETGQNLIVCQLRGRLKQGRKLGDIVAIGDWVMVTEQEPGKGMIEEVEPRQSMIYRMAPTARGEFRQVIIANPDQAVFVFSVVQPAPKLRMLDRFLVIAEKENVPALITFWRGDQEFGPEANLLFDQSIKQIFCTEDVVVLAEVLARSI